MLNSEKGNTPESLSFSSSPHFSQTKASTDYGWKMLNQAATGLLFGLRIHDGNILRVTKDEVIAGSPLMESTINYYYPAPYIILRETEEMMSHTIRAVPSVLNTLNRKISLQVVVSILLEALSAKKEALHILALTKNQLFWQKELEFLPKQYALSWQGLPSDQYKLQYHCFCLLFAEIIKFWSEKDFSSFYLEACTQLISAPLTIPSIFSEGMENVFFKQNSPSSGS